MVLVDSSVWIESLRQTGRLEVKYGLRGLLDAAEAQWCSPVRLEVVGGAREQDRTGIDRFFSVIPYRRSTEKDWELAVALGWRLQERGFTFPWMDILIAAIAGRDGTRIYSIDGHFVRIAEVTGIGLYEPGDGGAYNPG